MTNLQFNRGEGQTTTTPPLFSMLLLRLPVAFALLVSGISGLAGCSRDPPPQPAPAASASPAAVAAPNTNPNTEAKPTKPPAAKAGPAVVIAIEKASATRTKDGLLIRCEATLHNRTSEPLEVVTNFTSPFDGLEIVVTTEEGKELTRQAYIHHQSPSAEDQRIPLAPGPTTKTLVFPIPELNDATGPLNVKLAGGIPGTSLRSGLVSNEVDVVIEEAKGAP